MSKGWGVAILMNNYFHDVATALLLASSLCVWVIAAKAGDDPDEPVREYFLRIYDATTKIAKFALYWILLAGVPRVIYFKELEWNNMVGKDMVPAIIVKHILMVIIVGTGVHMWIRLAKRVKRIRARQ